MKVNELANELGKTSKQILEMIKQADPSAKMFSVSPMTADQEAAVRNAAAGKKGGQDAGKSADKPAKKKLTAVFRPQNAQQQIKRPVNKDAQAPKEQEKATAPRQENAPERAQSAQNARPAENARPNRDNNGERREGNRERGERREGGFGNRDNRDRRDNNGERREGNRERGERREGGFGNRDNRDSNRSGFGNRDNRDGNRPGFGNRDNRDGNRSGFGNRDNRDGNRSGFGNRDNRDGNRPGFGNRDNRDGNRPGFGNRDNRDGNRPGFGGNRDNRDGNRTGGFGGNRDSRDGNRSGGFGAGRGQGGQGRPSDRRGGAASRGGAFDTPIQAKPTSTRQTNKNAHKNDRFDKRDRDDDKSRKTPKTGKGAFIMPPKKEEAKVEEVKTITIPETLTIRELADKMKMQPSVIVKKLFLKGQMVTLNQEVDYDQAEEIAMEFDILCEKEQKVDVIAELLKEDEENPADMVPRPPVVCVMGHVDHGKTSLLDAIRETNVTAREAGGITQHIGASVIEINDRKITFLDTPGHEAFTAMRMRGAQSTDIAILVVAADDGVMPQTIEAINHAKAAGVEIIVAINKIDKPSANIEKVKQELSEYELIPEDWGGSTIFVPVSAHTKEGITDLLEMVLLTADVLELKANPNRKGRGLVIEAELDKGKGPVATVLVQKGTLHVGDTIAAGACYGRIRAMMDDMGRRVKEAGPSTPVEILGLNDVPNAGEVFVQTENEKEARSFAETFISEGKNKLIEDTKAKLSLDDLFSQIKAGNVKELPIIIKADVQGSVEAVKQSLMKLSNEEVMVKVIHGGVGAITESDVSLASASNAIIIGFNIRPDVTAKAIAEREKVDVRLYKVIYQAIEDVEAAMKGMLDPIFEEKVIGHAVVRQTFKASGVGTIAGSYVLDGKFTRGCKCRVTRQGEQLFDGNLASLKRFKDDVKEVAAGYECGLVFEKYNDLQEDDEIEAYTMVEVPR